MAFADNIVSELMGSPTATMKTPFTQLLPYERFLNRETLQAIARNRVMPEEIAKKRYGMDNFDTSGAVNGAFRSGRFLKNRARVSDSYDRSAEERVNQFYNPLVDEMTNRYNMLYDAWNKDPGSDLFKNITNLTPKAPVSPQYTMQNSYMDNPFLQSKLNKSMAEGTTLDLGNSRSNFLTNRYY